MRVRTTVKHITLVQVETVAHELARATMEWSEPIPDFATRFPDKLESCITTPFQKYGNRSLYAGLTGKGGILFYLMIKNHPFQNGNKRVAVMTLLYFLFLNGKWLKATNAEIYDFAKEVAGSDPAHREKVMVRVRSFIRKNLVVFPHTIPKQ